MPPATDHVFAHEKEETVLCFHGPLIYEASIKDRVARDGPDFSKIKLYFVHYSGWSSHWDEWAPESRVLKNNPQNLQLQKNQIKEFQRAHKRKKAEVSAANAATASSSAAALQPAKKQKKGDENDEHAGLAADIREQLRLPQSMKLKLIEDWERITREKKLAPLPRSPSISELLDHFLQQKAKRTSHERLYGEVSDGVKTFFNQAIGTVLLYKYERKQFRELKEAHKGTPYTELYGAEHLLRLFVKLPELLAHCKMQHEHLTVLLAKLLELLKFMQANKAQYFAETYEPASDEYLQWWSQE